MPVVTEDTIEGSGANLTIKGWVFERVFTVTELVEVGSAKYVEAVDATGIPFGASHPAIPTAFAIEFTPSPLQSSDAVAVTIRYKEYAQDYLTEIGSRTLNDETIGWLNNPDASDGDPRDSMVLLYTYEDDYKLKPELAGELVEQSVRLSVQMYFPTIVITRTEFLTIGADTLSNHATGFPLTGEILTDRQLLYNGRTNKANWALRPNDAKHLWRLEMTAVSAEDGLAFRVRYAFSYDPNEWRFEATYIDPYSGQPVPNPIDNIGKINYDQYLAQNFTLLELT